MHGIPSRRATVRFQGNADKPSWPAKPDSDDRLLIVDAQTFNAPCQQAPVHQLQAFDASLVLDQLKRDPIK